MNKRRNNSASRVHAILVRARDMRPGKSEPSTALDVWARVFKVTEKEHYGRERKVATVLTLLQREVDHIEDAMRATENPPDLDLYRRPLATAREIFSVAPLPHAWASNVAAKITGEVVQALGWCAREMPDDGETLTEDQVNHLLSELRDLITIFENSQLRPALKTFILQQLRLIEQAIINYPVVGSRHLVETFIHVRRDIGEREGEIYEAERAPGDESQRTLWERFQTYGTKLYATLAGLVQFAKLLKEGYDTVEGFFLPSAPGAAPRQPGRDDTK